VLTWGAGLPPSDGFWRVGQPGNPQTWPLQMAPDFGFGPTVSGPVIAWGPFAVGHGSGPGFSTNWGSQTGGLAQAGEPGSEFEGYVGGNTLEYHWDGNAFGPSTVSTLEYHVDPNQPQAQGPIQLFAAGGGAPPVAQAPAPAPKQRAGPPLRFRLDFERIPAARVREMVKQGLAQQVGDYVYIADVTPGGYVRLVLEPYRIKMVKPSQARGERAEAYSVEERLTGSDWNPKNAYYRVVSIKRQPVGAGDPLDWVKRARNKASAQRHVALYEESKANQSTQLIAGVAILTMTAVPLVGATDHLVNGQIKEGLISLVGDAATLLTGPLAKTAKFYQLTKLAKGIRIAGFVTEGGVGAIRLGQGIEEGKQNGFLAASGYFGEALLRLAGVSTKTIRALKARAVVRKIVTASRVLPVPKGYTRVYRAVSEAEYQQILKTGKLEMGKGTLEGKWFADSIEGAKAHGKGLYPDGKFRLIEADVPDNAPSLHKDPNLDGRGPSRYLHIEDLKLVKPRPVD
jgi:hypothetical protein